MQIIHKYIVLFIVLLLPTTLLLLLLEIWWRFDAVPHWQSTFDGVSQTSSLSHYYLSDYLTTISRTIPLSLGLYPFYPLYYFFTPFLPLLLPLIWDLSDLWHRVDRSRVLKCDRVRILLLDVYMLAYPIIATLTQGVCSYGTLNMRVVMDFKLDFDRMTLKHSPGCVWSFFYWTYSGLVPLARGTVSSSKRFSQLVVIDGAPIKVVF